MSARSETIAFKTPTQCLGRNGVMKMAGIHVSRLGDDVYVAPVTSRMRIGRAWMLVPADMIPDVIAAMRKVSGATRESGQRAA